MERLKFFKNKLILPTCLLIISVVNANTLVHKKFEYKYSFKPPYLAQRDGSVPFWEYGGNAIASSENVRIAPSLRSQKGAIWTKTPINFDWWEIDIAFRVSGRGRVGADGLAFWYTQNKGSYDGDVFGSSDKWIGLGLFFDSFDNDGKHNNPYIMAVLNDGSKEFDHQNDGSTQSLAGCLRDFRNKAFPTRARVEYYNNILTVLFHNGMTNNEQDYEVCLRAENVILPKNGYFGVSAATGGLADDHDVIHFLTNSLHPPGQININNQVSGDEQQKLTQEYQEYQKKLEQQKEDYRKEHPDATKEPEMDEWFESDGQRELRQIFQGQNQIFNVIRELNAKLDEIVGRQERTMSLITQQAAGIVQHVPAGGQHAPPPPPPPAAGGAGFSDTIRRHEVDAVLNNQNQIINAAREIRQFVADVMGKADVIINNQAKQPTAQVQSVGYDTQAIFNEMREGLNHVKQNMATFAARTADNNVAGCPTVSCVSLTSLLVIAVIQLVVLLAYNIYRDSKDNQAKKFY